ncbi:hypothetical protein AYK20_05385 [Thermoplasmatales archaeon SG8-52-1]|nr:MAG: hypothetical protein AYK20_05385 [Thermoplasmatales archaeon SG8-52-1]
MITTLSNKYMHRFLIVFSLFLILFCFTDFVFAENNNVIIEFYFADGCDHCEEKIPIIDEIEEHYKENVSIIRYSIEIYENRQRFFQYSFNTTPGVVVKNETSGKFSIFPYELITFENIINAIDYYLAGNDSIKPPVPTKNTTFCFLGFCFDVSKLSLPVLTIAMAFLDSFNPCAFFILIFLLNLLIYVRSRRRMLLIGGIFIFFSAFIYFLLMSAILNVIIFVEQQFIIRIIAGGFALVFGFLNIKDFFLFKKGITLSISDEKKSDLFKRMRKIVKTPFLPAMIIGTIVLAIFANTYELLCSLGLPLVYTAELTTHNLDNIQYYMYLIFYNLIYILPLLIILLIFVIKLGGRKLTEWQGRLLKLISGFMMFTLGLVLWISPDLLKNVFATAGIILISIISSYLISVFWKKYKSNNPKTQE